MNILDSVKWLFLMNIQDFVLNWILNWIILRHDSMKKWIFKMYPPGLGGGQHSQLLICYFMIHFLPSICRGDSGGPMFSIRDQKRYELVAFKCFLRPLSFLLSRWIMMWWFQCIWAFSCFVKTMLLIRWGQLHSTIPIVILLGWEYTYFDLFIHFCEWSDWNTF